MTNDFSYEPIARDDVSLDDFTETFEVVVADDEPVANGCSRLLSLLDNVDVNEILLPELPSQSDTVLAAG